MYKNQGFSVVEGLLIVAIVGVIGFGGWYVWHARGNANKSLTAANTASQTANATDCFSDTGLLEATWKTVEHRKVIFSDWKVGITLPSSSVGKAVCKLNGGGYEFSTKALLNDSKCVDYYGSSELVSPSISISRYEANSAAEGQVGTGTPGSLDDYYQAHKASSGNYFTSPIDGRNYYKVGNYFYVAFGDAVGISAEYKAAREAACKSEKPDYAQVFVDALSTIKQL